MSNLRLHLLTETQSMFILAIVRFNNLTRRQIARVYEKEQRFLSYGDEDNEFG